LTDLEKATEGRIAVKSLGVVTFNDRNHVRLEIAGTIRGVDANGPVRHLLDGTAYFDSTTRLLVHVSLKASKELLDGQGQVNGRIEGRMTVTRSLTTTETLGDPVLKGLTLSPTPDITRLLYENDALGLALVHPRNWRVGAVQGAQITLDGPGGAGILITMANGKAPPTAQDYLAETREFVTTQKGTMGAATAIARTQESPLKIDRFGYDAQLNGKSQRLEYSVVAGTGRGATLAAILPRADATELTKDFDAVTKSVKLTAIVPPRK
jgi:hypothetical protein